MLGDSICWFSSGVSVCKNKKSCTISGLKKNAKVWYFQILVLLPFGIWWCFLILVFLPLGILWYFQLLLLELFGILWYFQVWYG